MSPSSSSSKTYHQWLSLVGIIWLQSLNGTNTNFPAYSSHLKHLLSLSQIQLNNLAFASDAGKLFGFLSGLATIYLPLWLVLLMGSVLGLISYGIQFLFLTNYITSLSYPLIFLVTVIAGNSICWINTVCYVVALNNFPFDSQLAVGLSTSYQGLSAKIYTVLVNAFFFTSSFSPSRAYLLLNSTLPFAASLMAAPLIREINVENEMKLQTGFIVIFMITVSTGIYAVVSSLGLSGLKPLENAIGVLVFLLAPVFLPLGLKMRDSLFKKGKVHNFNAEEVNNGVRMENGVNNNSNDNKEEEMEIINGNYVNVKEEIGFKILLMRVNFWLYFFIYLFGATIGMVYLNNLGQIAESRGCSRTYSLVSLSSSFGFFGRLIPSLLDYFFSRSKHMISRPASIAALMGPMAGAFFLLLETSNVSLYISTGIIGICTGAITSISVSTTTELFGTKNFSINHNLVVANIPIGSFIFGYLAAILYRKQANNGGDDDGKCIGTHCYRITFILWGSLCFLGTFLALILFSRVRKFYSLRSYYY